jgi:hypothetical protein
VRGSSGSECLLVTIITNRRSLCAWLLWFGVFARDDHYHQEKSLCVAPLVGVFARDDHYHQEKSLCAAPLVGVFARDDHYHFNNMCTVTSAIA